MNEFSYPAEKFAAARRNLMLPHSKGESESIAHAFHECALGLHHFNRELLDDSSRPWIERLDELMNTDGVRGDHSRHLTKARSFTVDEMIEVSRLVDDLAWWFDRRNLGMK